MASQQCHVSLSRDHSLAAAMTDSGTHSLKDSQITAADNCFGYSSVLSYPSLGLGTVSCIAGACCAVEYGTSIILAKLSLILSLDQVIIMYRCDGRSLEGALVIQQISSLMHALYWLNLQSYLYLVPVNIIIIEF